MRNIKKLFTKINKQYLLYAGAVVWFFILLVVVLYLFFPHQKFVKIAFQNFLCGNKMMASIEGAKIRPVGAVASKIVFGHEGLQGKPLFEIEKIKISWNPFSLVKGVLSISSDASAYTGKMKVNIEGIPVIINSLPNMKINLSNINLAKYPENRLPWFKGVSGTLNGWVKKDMPLYAPERQKGSFSINMRNGEIMEIAIKNLPRLTIPYKDITIEGRIDGERINLTKIVINSSGNSINGNGIIEANEFEQKVNLKFNYEATTKNAPLAGKGTITISGNQWSPDIVITPEVPEKPSVATPAPQKK
ncbi:MAG: type II secretion system protein GspN [Proteobacteria bacterium]|nr:type II secretion system protein GspN [Pseudomonadota bacterium]